VLPAALEHGVGVVIAGVYNSGLLAQNRPARDARYDYAAAPPEVLARVHLIADVCEQSGVTLPDAALAYVRTHPAVIATVVGARTAAQVASNVSRSRTQVPADLWAALRTRGLAR